MSSSEKDLVQESVREFFEGLHSLVPMRHFSEYHEEDMIRKAAQEESNKVLNNFIRKTEALNDLRVKGDVLKELCLELEKAIEEHLTKNEDHKAKAESFLKKRTEDLCEDFKGTFEAKLLLKPDMDLKSAEEFLENGKRLAICYFEHNSNFGNRSLYEKQKRELHDNLYDLGKKMLEKQCRHLENLSRKDVEKSLNAVKTIVLSLSEEIKCDIDTLQDLVSKNQLKTKIIHDYLVRNGNLWKDQFPNRFEDLVETLEESINYLNDAEENMAMSLEVGSGLAAKLNQQLQSYFKDQNEVEGHGDTSQKNGNGLVVTSSNDPGTDEGDLANVGVEETENLNVHQLFRAIRKCQSANCIEEMPSDGLHVHCKASDGRKGTAAHDVIILLINKTLKTNEAIAILDLLVAKGFNMINERDGEGLTPLLLALDFEHLTANLLSWFSKNGADFNAVTGKDANSVLFIAIEKRQSAEVIRSILDFGGNPKYTNVRKNNALHMSAWYANDPAMTILVDILDVNDADDSDDESHLTPLHFLFADEDLDYEHCLKTLLMKGADMNAKCCEGIVPLVEWITYDGGNPFPTLFKMRNTLSISAEIASAALTAIVEEMERLQKFLPSLSSTGRQNELAQFIQFLIVEKKGMVKLKNELKWRQEDWGAISKIFLKRELLETLGRTCRIKWNGELSHIEAKNLGKLDFCTKSSNVSVSIEIILFCILAAKDNNGFVKVCQFVEKFCD